ncbi:hypothetical protein DFQ05_2133 [Winogradskyella wandonensis]|uniref:Uncharacterized protein n=1 Tax=Winogradskyella wandonensis TaxID=1442586 RepID=A0A4R1KPC2_9FLAO|nr:hypothetical protein DFQ05_2133 [Winogradskyella wandonensis]
MNSKLKMKLKKKLWISFAVLFFILSNYTAFYRAKRQAYLECIDFNVLSIIDNTITFGICFTLSLIGVLILKRK